MKNLSLKIGLFSLILLIAFFGCNSKTSTNEESNVILIQSEDNQLTYLLPAPNTDGDVSVEKALANRRSYRNFQNIELSQEQLSQILWAAYGITEPRENPAFLRGGLRTAPSAGALYPFEIYVIVGNVKGIDVGVYKYVSQEHKLIQTIDKDVREELCTAALGQKMVKEAPVTVFYSAIFSRMTDKYGERGRERYVCMDLGHSAQNIYLQAEALQLGTCAIGAFIDKDVSVVLQLPEEEEPLYMMPVGYR
jgi:SagB-type dehydrogenase family enzyme